MNENWNDIFACINDGNFIGWTQEAINGYITCRATIIEKMKMYNVPTRITNE